MIHEKGITLSESERNRLRKNAMSQDRQIVLIFKERPTHAFTFHDIVKATNFNQDSAKRSISNMAGSGDLDKYKDKYGRFPLIKTAKKKLNPDTGVNITCYKWNIRFGKPPTHSELLEKHKNQGQMDFRNQ
jgi:hypothetical protein